MRVLTSCCLLLMLFLCVSGQFIVRKHKKRAAKKTLWELLKEEKSASWFYGVAKKTHMGRILESRPMTVFVPTNAAYQKLTSMLKWLLNYNLNKLYYVILYHFIIDGVYPTRFMADGMMLPLGLDKRGFLNVRRRGKKKSDIWIQGFKILKRDIKGRNGVMHIIDGVLFPPENKLTDLMDTDRHSDIMKSILNRAGFVLPTGYTMFTPHDEAFKELTAVGIKTLKRSRRAARVFVSKHIIPKPIFMSSITGYGPMAVKTLAGSTVTLVPTANGVYVNIEGDDIKYSSKIDKSDLTVTNGVMHSVRRVLSANEAFLKAKINKEREFVTPKTFTAAKNTKGPTTLQVTTQEVTKAPTTTEGPTTLPVTTVEVTKAPTTTEEPPTLPVTTKEATQAPTTTEEPTTLPVTTKEVTQAPKTTEGPTTLPVTTVEVTKAPTTTEEPPTLPVTTQEVTKAPTTTEGPTTLPITTKEVTQAPTTTEEPTTLPVTTKEVTQAPTTTEGPTTLPITTKEVTQAPTTTEEPTTLPVTTKEVTQAPTTTEGPTTLPVTTVEVTKAPTTTEEPPTLPVTTKEATQAPTATEEPTTLPATTIEVTQEPTTTEEATTLPATTKEVTQAPTTKEEPTTLPVTTIEVTQAPTTTKEPTTLPVTTKEVTKAPTTAEEPTTLPATTIGVTQEPTTTEEATTLPATTKEVTQAPTTKEEPTTLPVTTMEVTQAPTTTKEPTTLPVTTKEVTKAPTTAEEPTTLPATTIEVTQEPTMTEEATTLPATTKEVTQAPTTKEEPTTLPVTTKEVTQAPTTTEEPTTLPVTTKEVTQAPTTTEGPTTLPITTKEVTQAPTTTEEPTTLPVTTKEVTQAPTTTEEPTTLPVTTVQPTTPASPVCTSNRIQLCQDIYNFTVYPNSFKHKNPQDVWSELKQFVPLAKTGCSVHVRRYICSLYTPPCVPGEGTKILTPCRSFCSAVRKSCIGLLNNVKLAERFDCSKLPVDSDAACYGIPGGKIDGQVRPTTQLPNEVVQKKSVRQKDYKEPLLNLKATLIKNKLTEFLKHVMEFEDLRPILTDDTQKYTIFAPTNEAFSNLNGNNKKSFTEDKTYRRQVMKYHIIPQDINTKGVRFREIRALSGNPLILRSYEKRQMADHAFILSHDEEATNGWINIVDRLMIPYENHLVSVITNREKPSVSLFRKAISMTGMLETLKQRTEFRYILWVPTDDAFLKLSKATLQYIFTNMDVLRNMVNFHLTPGYFHTNLMTTRWVYVFRTRIPGIRLRVRKISQRQDGLIVYNKITRTARSVLINLGATNGIINLIDTVLFPPNIKFPDYAKY